MDAEQRSRDRAAADLIAAAGILFLSALPWLVWPFIAAEPGGFSPLSLGPLVAAAVVIAAGVETLRRRHLLFALLVPGVLAAVNLGYVVFSAGPVNLIGVIFWAVPALLIALHRRDFH
jgi:hypothetical protein